MTNWEKWLKENKKVSDYAILCNFYFDKRECPLADSEKGCKGCNEDKFNKWANAEDKKIIAKCSNCTLLHDLMYGTRYCPNCGAKMRGDAE